MALNSLLVTDVFTCNVAVTERLRDRNKTKHSVESLQRRNPSYIKKHKKSEGAKKKY